MAKDNNSQNYYIGINTGGHDSSITLLHTTEDNLEVEVFLSERIHQEKYKGGFPILAIKKLVAKYPQIIPHIPENHICINRYGEAPETYLNQAIHQKSLRILEALNCQKLHPKYNRNIRFITHHRAHAFSLLHAYPFDESLILVQDGIGSYSKHFPIDHDELKKFPSKNVENRNVTESLTLYHQRGNQVTPIEKKWEEIQIKDYQDRKVAVKHDAMGLYHITSEVLFGRWENAGKVMGLAAYGKGKDINEITESQEELLHLDLNGKETNYDELPDSKFGQLADIAATIQAQFEKAMIKQLTETKAHYPHLKNISIAGGAALNCILNSKISESKLFDEVYIPAHPSDNGISLGCALECFYHHSDSKINLTSQNRIDPFLGIQRKFVDESTLKKHFKNATITEAPSIANLIDKISEDKVLAIFQGRSEIGKRALGNRSILAHPLINDIKGYLNCHIKFREEFRPYGIIILEEELGKYFEDTNPSPFMAMAPKVKSSQKEFFKEIFHPNSRIRVQTINSRQYPLIYNLLREFHNQTEIPFLINTSLNIMGKPILESIQDLSQFATQSKIKHFFIDDYLITKSG